MARDFRFTTLEASTYKSKKNKTNTTCSLSWPGGSKGSGAPCTDIHIQV